LETSPVCFGETYTEGNAEDIYDNDENFDLDAHTNEWAMKSGLSCVVCGPTDEGCIEGSSLDQYLKNCTLGENFCQIMKLKTESSTTVVSRSCAEENKNVECSAVCTTFTSCSTDGCNHGNQKYVFSHVMSVVGLFVAIMLVR